MVSPPSMVHNGSIVLIWLWFLLHCQEQCNAEPLIEACDAENDSCPSRLNGRCDNERGYNREGCEGGDCFDCDRCKEFRGDCQECVAHGCFWCPGSVSCFETPLYTTLYKIRRIPECILPEEYTQTCAVYFTKYVTLSNGALVLDRSLCLGTSF